MNVCKIGQVHTLLQTHSTVYKETGLTVVPSRSSPEAETCTEPHRCGWSEPLLSSVSDKKRSIQR